MNWRTVRFDGQIDFSKFVCSEPVLNDYLHKQAVRDHEADLCTLYFLLNERKTVGAFYVISNGSIRRQDLPTAKARKSLPGYPLGTVHIGRLARHKDLVGLQLGKHVLFSALATAVESAKTSAAFAVTVDAKNELAERYYAEVGFVALRTENEGISDYPKAMYLRMKDARAIIAPISES